MKKNTKLLLSVFLLFPLLAFAESPLIQLFPLDRYADQNVDSWINPKDSNCQKSLMSEAQQKAHYKRFYQRFMGDKSPWSAEYVSQLLKTEKGEDAKTLIKKVLADFSNPKDKPENKIIYGENFRPYGPEWIRELTNQVNLSQFENLTYQSANRAIITQNLQTRTLPTDEPAFYSHKMAGEGYPFDNLQMSSIWIGTPVYILGETKDKAWFLVLTPDFVSWVKSSGVVRVNDAFVKDWRNQADKSMAAIIKTKTPLKGQKGDLLSLAYVGTVLPAKGNQLMVPVKNAEGKALVKHAPFSAKEAVLMPQKLTPCNLAKVMKTLVGRPYGWGGMYFYSDCSQEMKSLYTPFGVWMGRNSSQQAKAGHVLDLSELNNRERLSGLLKKGRPFATMVYVEGHIVLYLGAYKNKKGNVVPMIYQDVWGMIPKSVPGRWVIGKSLFFPLLLEYPENPDLYSLLDKKIFKLIYLDDISGHVIEDPKLKDLI